MTIIEVFDENQLENIVAGISFFPKKIVYVGFEEIMTSDKIKAITNFFESKKLNTKLEFEIVPRYDYDAIVNKLNNILDLNPDASFDLTGGMELVLVAMGEISEKRNIRCFQFNIESGEFVPVKNCNNMNKPIWPHMTIKESVMLSGGSVINDALDAPWTLSDDFKNDIETMWGICNDNCGQWNRQCDVFSNLHYFGTYYNLKIEADLSVLKRKKKDTFIKTELVDKLINEGLIFDFKLYGDFISFRYKNEQVKRCLTKAGNVLELYAYMILCEIKKEAPGFYDDIDVGVFVDWDGKTQNGSDEKDTKNEIDLMIMRDLVPIYISCKNGQVHKEALYELLTVAEKFGGKYAKKFLLASYISNDPESKEYIKQRASDMGITLIYDFLDKSKPQLKELFKDIIK